MKLKYLLIAVGTILYFLSVTIFAQINKLEPSKHYWSHCINTQFDIAYGDLKRQTLDIHQQGKWMGEPNYFVPGKKPLPTLVYIHGGAWHGGNKAGSAPFLLHYLERGYQVVNIEYRIGSDTAPNAADDVLLAMQWISKNAEKYALDLKNLVVSGDSAGGHLALIAGLESHENKNNKYPLNQKIVVKAIINWFGISDLLALDDYFVKSEGWNYPRLWAGNSRNLVLLAPFYSPIERITENSPDILSIHGDADKVVPFQQSVELHKKLNELNVENRLLSLKGGKHLGFSDEQFQTIYHEIFTFLESRIVFE